MLLHRRALLGGLSAAGLTGLVRPARAGVAGVAAPDSMTLAPMPAAGRALPPGLFDAYARNRQDGVASLVTESFLVHALSLTRRRAQAADEAAVLMPALATWIAALVARAAEAPDLPDLARDTIAVLAALQSGREAAAARPLALAEYEQVVAAAGIGRSKLTGVALDFTQFRPRGAYAGDPRREAYFRTFRYAGTLAFLLVPSAATGVSEAGAQTMAAAAFALSRLSRTGAAEPVARALFAALETRFGPADDFGPFDAPDGGDAAAALAQWRKMAQAPGRVPQVIDVIYDARRLDGRSPGEVAVSWRLLPGRRLGDVAALQQLVYPATGLWTGTGKETGTAPFDAGFIDGKPVKAYVGLDDVFALTAPSDAAPAAPAAFAGLAEALAGARRALIAADDAASPVLRLLRAGQEDAPLAPFRAQALAAAYIHHRHATLLVAKQSYAAADKSIRLAPARTGARLASTPAFVRALAVCAQGFARLCPDAAWGEWARVLGRLEDIAWAQQRWNTPSAAADALLNDLDLQLGALIDRAHDGPLVVDIHTCPAEGKVVELGLGRPLGVTSGGAVGALLPACQFKQPLAERLTDAAWAAGLPSDGAPPATLWHLPDAPLR